jgi:predicted RNA-binding Zn-ribbon protein involved in translation (DUF1610 family)
MTIRQMLRRWFRFLWLGLMAVGILAGSWRPHTWLNYYLRMAVLTFLAISVIGVFAFGFVCPRCRSSLVMKSSTIFGGHPCVCPKCGVSLDEPEKTHDNLT